MDDDIKHASGFMGDPQIEPQQNRGGPGSGNFGHAGRPGEVGGSRSSTKSSLMSKIRTSGGFSYHPLSDSIPTKGYMALNKERETLIPMDKATGKDIMKYMSRNSDLFADEKNYLGGWVDEGNLYLDISTRFDDVEAAKLAAKQHNQIAFFDLEHMQEIITDEVTKNWRQPLEGNNFINQNADKPQLIMAQLTDTLLSAYKAFITNFCDAAGIPVGEVTEAEWKENWTEYWQGRDK